MTRRPVFHVSFVGGGALFPLLLGKGYAVQRFLKEKYPSVPIVYSGISSGSFCALLLGLDKTAEEVYFLMKHELLDPFEKKWYLSEFTHLWFFLRRMLGRALGTEGYKTLQGRFYAAVAKVVLKGKAKDQQGRKSQEKLFTPLLVSDFLSNQDVIDAVMTSAHLPFLGRHLLKLFKGKWAVDGGAAIHYVDDQTLQNNSVFSTLYPPHLYQPVTFVIWYHHFPESWTAFHQMLPLFSSPKYQRMYTFGCDFFKANQEKKLQHELQRVLQHLGRRETLGPRCEDSKSGLCERQDWERLVYFEHGFLKGATEVLGGYSARWLNWMWHKVFHQPF